MRICCALVLATVCCVAQESTRSISGTVTDRLGTVIPGATVTLSGSTIVAVKSDDKGKFGFPRPESGAYKLRFDKPGFEVKIVDVTVGQDLVFLHDVVLDVRDLGGIQVSVLPDNTVPSNVGSISGTVRYRSSGVPNALVILQLSGESQGDELTRTDANGNFKLDKVRPGLYDLMIKANGWETATINSIALQNGRAVTLPAIQLMRPTTRVR